MKKIWRALGALAAAVALTACAPAEDTGQLYIQKAELSQEEQGILNLVGCEAAPYILEFAVDETVQSLQINTYELQDGAWKMVSGGGGRQLQDAEGRIALTFDNIGLGLRTGLQSEHGKGSDSYETNSEFRFEGLGTTTSYLSDQTPIVYEEEIPLVIQIHTAKNEVSSLFPAHGFFEPQTYEEQGYEKVYAITCRFSQKTVGAWASSASA